MTILPLYDFRHPNGDAKGIFDHGEERMEKECLKRVILTIIGFW
jgi:hypothetical protein